MKHRCINNIFYERFHTTYNIMHTYMYSTYVETHLAKLVVDIDS